MNNSVCQYFNARQGRPPCNVKKGDRTVLKGVTIYIEMISVTLKFVPKGTEKLKVSIF